MIVSDGGAAWNVVRFRRGADARSIPPVRIAGEKVRNDRSMLLAKLADMVLMVVRYNQVDRKLARRSLVALRRTDARVVGVVLNGIDPKSDSYHYYYSYYQERREHDGKVTRMRHPSSSSSQRGTASGAG